MAEYTFRHERTGAERTIVQRMNDEHPERIGFDPATGAWFPDQESGPWHRVYGCAGVKVPEYGVAYKGQKLPVSRTLPTMEPREGVPDRMHGQFVRRYADGTITDNRGRRIISNKADAQRAESTTGYKRD